jgi:hypothetical protein
MPENARTFYQTLDGQVEQNKIYTKLAIPILETGIRTLVDPQKIQLRTLGTEHLFFLLSPVFRQVLETIK